MDYSIAIQRLLAKVPQAALAKALTLGLALYALYLAALITWQLVPVPEQTGPAWRPTAVTSSGGGESASLDGLLGLSLFGTPDKDPSANQPAQPVQRDLITDAPKTTLRILLTGLVASSVEERGIAIIESGGSQETYGIGDKIKGTNASLHEVYADRAIILNQGRYETLMLDGVEYTREMTSETQRLRETPQAEVDMRDDAETTQALEEAREAMLEDPGKLQDYLAISPVKDRESGELRGYRLNPGKNRELFMQSGLQPNDLAVSMNGYDLTNMGESMQILSQLADLEEVSLMVEREGQLTEVLFALPSQ
ncbi:general secretion pathway protein C [Ferrimonas balearica DSM 9799]|uniref:General secretion pathway protein C n=1 Tax=Ferrimonas balearica (strain DSM 9799 / CCM 4581 / KCTC 23876 / PAT) TaxID=550540 RepID=E1SL33_FERBD|nr:type II secretion system protein GspC [Ferrimonas balearica]MBY6019455.1 type II secretion system protein GspC [Halomonas denitrificans]ADN74427.1 general secretion pathway protein C [Ferrimonas balearica DSM 9799]MBW3141152.1 type II secretion system protein GspC [Ferrimonas balearica]MBW3166007.1 type II secretion system protein GspC [Ferrimonas balearica]MBY5982067.1 type II secretion system protein GspC [Ferrimonas balearica]